MPFHLLFFTFELKKTTEEPPFSTCLFITNVTKIRDANIERPRLKGARNSKSYTKRDEGVREGIVWKERSKGGGGGGGVVVRCSIHSVSLEEAGQYRYSLQGDDWPERIKSCFQWCTVQRGILITLD